MDQEINKDLLNIQVDNLYRLFDTLPLDARTALKEQLNAVLSLFIANSKTIMAMLDDISLEVKTLEFDLYATKNELSQSKRIAFISSKGDPFDLDAKQDIDFYIDNKLIAKCEGDPMMRSNWKLCSFDNDKNFVANEINKLSFISKITNAYIAMHQLYKFKKN